MQFLLHFQKQKCKHVLNFAKGSSTHKIRLFWGFLEPPTRIGKGNQMQTSLEICGNKALSGEKSEIALGLCTYEVYSTLFKLKQGHQNMSSGPHQIAAD